MSGWATGCVLTTSRVSLRDAAEDHPPELVQQRRPRQIGETAASDSSRMTGQCARCLVSMWQDCDSGNSPTERRCLDPDTPHLSSTTDGQLLPLTHSDMRSGFASTEPTPDLWVPWWWLCARS